MNNPQRATETSGARLLKATAVGGLLFLLPLILVAILLGHAVHLASVVTQPVSDLLALDRTIGPAGETILAIVGLVVIAIAAGIVARTRLGRHMAQAVEHSFLAGLPVCQMVKSMAEGLARIESANGMSPALVNLEGGRQIGYLLENLDKGWVAVFVPQAPTPMSGNVMYLPSERVRTLDMAMSQAVVLVKNMGIGSAVALSGIDLGQRSTAS